MANATPAKMNVLALVGMILSLVGLVLGLAVGWWVSGAFGALCLAGVICSHIAMKQIKTRNEGGRPLALTGIITGYIGLLFAVIQIITAIVIVLFFAAAVGVVEGVTSQVG
nr:MAG: hypothetical protein GM42_3095 [actinobacterium acMicro-1]